MADYDKSPQTNRLSCYTGSQLSVRLIFAFHYSSPAVRAPSLCDALRERAACHNFNNTSLSQFSSLTMDAGKKRQLKEQYLTLLVSRTAKETLWPSSQEHPPKGPLFSNPKLLQTCWRNLPCCVLSFYCPEVQMQEQRGSPG